MEGIAEALEHVTNAIKNINSRNGHVDIWDFMESGDARQLLRILDNHPEETITLVATLSTLNATTGGLMSYQDVRKTMCNFRFNSSYWSTPNRTRFIKEICSFDPYQLLRSTTSAEYYVSRYIYIYIYSSLYSNMGVEKLWTVSRDQRSNHHDKSNEVVFLGREVVGRGVESGGEGGAEFVGEVENFQLDDVEESVERDLVGHKQGRAKLDTQVRDKG